MIENRLLIKDALIMTQYEVAKRIIAKPRTKDYGILSVLMNYFATVELCFKISPNVFYPKPKVDSAIIKIDFQNNKEVELDYKLFIQVVKASFGNRRKTLKNSLSNSIYKDIGLSKIDFDFTRRAEELSIEEFIELTKKMKKLLSN
jgi:16S rRNA (adenine1518-N6/adenine1519-N6)-dimethyltransferase